MEWLLEENWWVHELNGGWSVDSTRFLLGVCFSASLCSSRIEFCLMALLGKEIFRSTL
jgi:hypothetical protein